MYLIAEVSPGAKLGSTAPYGRADSCFWKRVTAAAQPRGGLPQASRSELNDAVEKLCWSDRNFRRAYETGETRICLNLSGAKLGDTPTGSLADLAAWAEARSRKRDMPDRAGSYCGFEARSSPSAAYQLTMSASPATSPRSQC